MTRLELKEALLWEDSVVETDPDVGEDLTEPELEAGPL